MTRPNITPGLWRDCLHRDMTPPRTKVETRDTVIADTIGNEANAVAIAAVPELLAALESALLRLDHHGTQSAPECLQIRAALTKAGYKF